MAHPDPLGVQAFDASAQSPLALLLVGSFGDSGDPVYRLHQPAAALAQLEGVEVHELHPCARDRDAACLAADVLVLLMGMDVELLRLVHQRRLLGRPTVLEVNDWLPGVQRCNPVHANWSDRRAWTLLQALLRQCEAVQVSSAGLAERLAPHGRQLEIVANQLSQVPPLPPRSPGPLRVGWGGSAGHYDDVAAVAPALISWLHRHSDVQLELMADPQFARLFEGAPPERFRLRPAGSITGYLHWLEGLDVGLAPLLASDYNACRSDVKFLEYASRGVVPLLQRCATYASVRDGITGLLFRDSAELLQQLDALRRDGDRRARLAAAAHREVAQHRLQAQHAPRQLAWYQQLQQHSVATAATAATADSTDSAATLDPAASLDPARPPLSSAARDALQVAAGRSLRQLRQGPGWQRCGPRHWRRDLEGGAEQAYQAGLDALRQSDWSQALHLFRHATAADPSDPYPLVFLGHVLEQLQRPALAQQAYERAAGLDPLCSRPLRALAGLHRRQGRQCAAAAARLNPFADAAEPSALS